MKKLLVGLLVCILAAVAYYHYASHHRRNNALLLPRTFLLGTYSPHQDFEISPDGKWLKNYTGNITYIRNLKTGQTKELDLAWGHWNQSSQYFLWHTHDGNENYYLSKVEMETGLHSKLIDQRNVDVKILAESHLHPTKIIIGLNNRDRKFYDIYKLDIVTGKKTLIFQNTEFRDFYFDDDLKILFAAKERPGGGASYYTRQPDGQWQLYRELDVVASDFVKPITTDQSGEWGYWIDAEDSDKTNLIKMNYKTKEKVVIARGEKADIIKAYIHPMTKEVLGIEENYLRSTIKPLTKEFAEDLKILRSLHQGDLDITSWSYDFTKLIIKFEEDTEPGAYYLYDRNSQKAEFLGYQKEHLQGSPLAKTDPIEIKARDGLILPSYLTVPSHKDLKAPYPMVLLAHGGPYRRDTWTFNYTTQFLANRGYAVLQVNFRGSEGYGKAFLKAGFGEWGGKMQDDLEDGVRWAIKEGIADPKRIAIVGGSYGGYAALMGDIKTPDLFACVSDWAGPSNLVTMLESDQSILKRHYKNLFKASTGGDYTTLEGKEFLRSRSPATYINKIKKPIFISQGNLDVRVPTEQSQHIADILMKQKVPTTYLLFYDEGHGMNSRNYIIYFELLEAFLGTYLKGYIEPPHGEFNNHRLDLKVESNAFGAPIQITQVHAKKNISKQDLKYIEKHVDPNKPLTEVLLSMTSEAAEEDPDKSKKPIEKGSFIQEAITEATGIKPPAELVKEIIGENKNSAVLESLKDILTTETKDSTSIIIP